MTMIETHLACGSECQTTSSLDGAGPVRVRFLNADDEPHRALTVGGDYLAPVSEADFDIALGRTKTFDSMDDLIADLDSPE